MPRRLESASVWMTSTSIFICVALDIQTWTTEGLLKSCWEWERTGVVELVGGGQSLIKASVSLTKLPPRRLILLLMWGSGVLRKVLEKLTFGGSVGMLKALKGTLLYSAPPVVRYRRAVQHGGQLTRCPSKKSLES